LLILVTPKAAAKLELLSNKPASGSSEFCEKFSRPFELNLVKQIEKFIQAKAS
jgi:hypothetical protein